MNNNIIEQNKDFSTTHFNNTLDYAKYYVSVGLNVIPLKPRSKEPLISWKEYQNKLPTTNELYGWFSNNDNNIAILCGRVSGNLIVIDFDSIEKAREFWNKVKEFKGLSKELANTWWVRTGKGMHLYLRIGVSPEEFDKFFRTKPRFVEGVDIKGEGGYVVAPPSIHPSGERYEFFEVEGEVFGPPNVTEPMVLTEEEWGEILKMLGHVGVERRVERVRKSGLRVLGDNVLIELKELLRPAWVEGQRQLLSLYISGWLAKAKIHPVSVAKLFVMVSTETGDEELEQRLNTIYYSYRKAYGDVEELSELDEYVEELKAKRLITRTVSKGVSIVEEEVKGRTGVQEILESTLGEERALEVIRRISEILGYASPYRDSITILTDFEKGLGYTNHARYKRIYRSRRGKNGIVLLKVVWEGAITNLTVYENPLGGITRYEIVWETSVRTRPLRLGPATLEDIYDRLRHEGFLENTRLGKDALSSVINCFIRQGKAEVKAEIDTPGFYIIDGKLTTVKYDIEKVSIEELREALELLNELAEKWYGHVKERFAIIIKWGIIAPFVYARKQLGRQYQVPHIALYGARNTGKSTLAEIATIYMWGLDKIQHSCVGTQANTEARLGRVLSQGTLPIIIDEANAVFYKPELINMLKNSVEGLIARGKYTKTGYIDIPALAQIIFTLNPTPRVEFEDLLLVPKTMWLLYFTEGERLKEKQIEEFKREVEPRLEKLRAIGHYVANIVLKEGVECLKKDWLELAEELLEQAYIDAGLEPPEWIKLNYETKGFEDIDRERVEKIRGKLVKYINDMYARNISKIIGYIEEGREQFIEPEEVDIKKKLEVLSINRLIPFIIPKGDMLYITTGILTELGLELESLKSLSELLGWKYISKKKIKEGEKRRVISVVEVSLEELAEFLTPSLEE